MREGQERLDIMLTIHSQRHYNLRKFENKYVISDKKLIDITPDNPTTKYYGKLNLGN
ncbi:MAG: hypothetical protein L0H55_15495 [Candidatus Nitrosocosmicus sp.]|nr:hypothetical protein [Candidatus Nitrosocosmicus sp.]